MSESVNRFPDFVRYIVRRLKALCPNMGKVGIARSLARAGLHLAATTVGQILKGEPPCPDQAATASEDMQSIEAAISDKGPQFWCEGFKAWCPSMGISVQGC
jgi:hypothetical protein